MTKVPAAVEYGEIYGVLIRLAIAGNTVAFQQTAYAVYLAAREPDGLCPASWCLYAGATRHCHTTWK